MPFFRTRLFARAYALACVCALAWAAAPASAATISGTALRFETGTTPWQACDGFTPNVQLSVNGAPPVGTSCSRLTGVFSFTGVTKPAAGAPLTAWLDSSDSRGATYYFADGSATDVTDLDIVQDRVTLATEAPTVSVYDADLRTYDATEDADIPIDASGPTIIPSDVELHLTSGVT